MEKYEILSIIGEGSFGRVYKAKIKTTNETVALKLITKCGRSMKEITGLRRECEIQQNFDHPNIIRMLDSFETDNEIAVVTEFAYRDLYEILGKEGYLSEEKAKKIICDLVSALYYLHSNRVLHRDLKPQNVLLSTTGIAKLCDFGFARNMSMGTHVLTSIKGTPLYMAPELMEESPYDHNADLWSLGCIAYEMLVGSPPFTTTSILHLVRLIRHEPIKWPDFLSADCQSLLKGLLNKDPKERLTWPHLLEHPFLRGSILILGNQDIPAPLTNELTSSQVVAKELQKQELIRMAQTNSVSNYNTQTQKQVVEVSSKDDCSESSCKSGVTNIEEGLKRLYVSASDCKGSINDLETKEGSSKEPRNSEKLEEEWKEALNWDDTHSSPIEAEEWLAFLQQSMEEIMEGDVVSISQPGFVTMVSRALSSTSANVVEYVACLFSIPLVAHPVSQPEIKNIRKVYFDVQVVPKLVYASKLLAKRTDEDNNLSADQLQALEAIFLLITNLVYSEHGFLQQFCDSVALLSMSVHLTQVLSLRRRKIRLATDVIAILCHILRELPENASILEEIIKGFDDPEIEFRSMLTHSSDCLKIRTVTLLKLMAKYCCQELQSIWSDGLQNDIEALSYDPSESVRPVAIDALAELKKLPFYVRSQIVEESSV